MHMCMCMHMYMCMCMCMCMHMCMHMYMCTHLLSLFYRGHLCRGYKQRTLSTGRVGLPV